jgi:hypothetical protein
MIPEVLNFNRRLFLKLNCFICNCMAVSSPRSLTFILENYEWTHFSQWKLSMHTILNWSNHEKLMSLGNMSTSWGVDDIHSKYFGIELSEVVNTFNRFHLWKRTKGTKTNLKYTWSELLNLKGSFRRWLGYQDLIGRRYLSGYMARIGITKMRCIMTIGPCTQKCALD